MSVRNTPFPWGYVITVFRKTRCIRLFRRRKKIEKGRVEITDLGDVDYDSGGKLIGDPILGAHPDKYKELMDNSVVIQKMMTGPMFFISDHCIDIYISHTVEDIGFNIRILFL